MKKKWEKADNVLTRARHHHINSTGILASLAWARFHNPSIAVAIRKQEAIDLLILATQLNTEDDLAKGYLMHILQNAEGNTQA